MNIEKKYNRDAQNEDGLEVDIFKSIENNVVAYKNRYGIVVPLESTGTPDFTDVYNNLSANNSTASTTAILKYGVNVFTVATQNNFAAKLPQPTTGRTTIIVNNTTSPISLYPSNVGGKINNYPIDTPAIIPPDGKSYSFICIENPLPGEWVWSAPAIGQHDSGDISITVTGTGVPSANPYVAAINNIFKGIKNQFTGSTWGYDGKNKPLNLVYGISPNYEAAFKPSITWNGISKIKVYTNATTDSVFQLSAGMGYTLYDLNNLNTPITNGPNAGGALFSSTTSNVITGTVIDPGNLVQPNIGDPGTYWTEYTPAYPLSLNIVNSTKVGDFDAGNIMYPGTNPSDPFYGQLVQNYYSSYISFQIRPFYVTNYTGTKDFKFRFIIEYY